LIKIFRTGPPLEFVQALFQVLITSGPAFWNSGSIDLKVKLEITEGTEKSVSVISVRSCSENPSFIYSVAGAPETSARELVVGKIFGRDYIGVAVPVGNITPKQMLRLADLSDNYGSGEVRLSVWQNLIIPNIPDPFVETVKKALVKMGLHWEQSNLRSGLVACTGNSYCKFASSNTKSHALELADYLEKRVDLDQPINIHLTGCPNSCAQHYMGDIGLLGAKVLVPCPQRGREIAMFPSTRAPTKLCRICDKVSSDQQFGGFRQNRRHQEV